MNDDFEKRLQRIAPREIPPAWRSELLAAAQTDKPTRSQPRLCLHPIFSRLAHRLANLPRPQQLSWAALAAIWLGIAALNASQPTPANNQNTAIARPTPETRQALRQQKLLFVELVGPALRPVADRHQTQTPRPHSRRRSESFAV